MQRGTLSAQLAFRSEEIHSLCQGRALPGYTASALQPGGAVVYTLPELIDRGERENPDAKGAWESVKRAAALAGIEKSKLFPTLAFNGSAFKGDTLFGLPPNVSSAAVIRLKALIFQATVEADYSIDLGVTLNTYRATRHLLAAQKASLNQTNQKVALDVSTKYYDYLSAKESLRTALANEDNSCLNYDDSAEKLRNGLATIIDVQQAKARYLQARASSLSSAAKEADAKVSLASLVGLPPEQSIDVAPINEAPPVRILPENVESLWQHALQNRPEIAGSEEKIRAAEKGIRAARAKYLPTFSLTAQKSYTNSSSDTSTPSSAAAEQAAGTNTKGFTYLYSGQVKFTIFDFGATRNGIKALRATERQLRYDDQKSRLEVQQDVSKSYNDVLSAILSQDASYESLVAAKEYFEKATISRANGLMSDIDLSTAQFMYISAQSSYTDSRLKVLKSAAQLAHATGDILSTGAESPASIPTNP